MSNFGRRRGGIPPRPLSFSNDLGCWIVPLTHGHVAFVDDVDAKRVSKFCWLLDSTASMPKALSTGAQNHGVSKFLHRFVLGTPSSSWVRPRDGDYLNCRRSNLAQDEALYVLPHSIEIMAESAPKPPVEYWRVYVKPHPFFSSYAIQQNGCHYVGRNRVVMSSIVGRSLNARKEHVHHRNEDKADDRPENLELLSSLEHGRLHNCGKVASAESKAKASKTLKEAYRSGRRKVTGAAKTQMEASRASVR